MFLLKIFEDQAQQHKKFIDCEKARSDFRIKEDDYNQFNYYESIETEKKHDIRSQNQEENKSSNDQNDEIWSLTIKNAISPHKIELDENLRQEITQINFEIEHEE